MAEGGRGRPHGPRTWRTAWEREETWLAAVDSVLRLRFPSRSRSSTCAVPCTSTSGRPDTTTTPRALSSRIARGCRCGAAGPIRS
jgi:hypothetical protein